LGNLEGHFGLSIEVAWVEPLDPLWEVDQLMVNSLVFIENLHFYFINISLDHVSLDQISLELY
jgi:hypothetical protein